jgi:transcriptional regulator with XRE-family HTH domain
MATMNDPIFAARLRELIAANRTSYRALAARTHYGKSYLHDLATGRKRPSADAARKLDDALSAGGALAAAAGITPTPNSDDEIDALELARLAAASDVTADTLSRLETAFDGLATSYATVPPEELLPRVRRHLEYVTRLLDGRKTLQQHRQLLVLGGWLSLLAATVHIDLRQPGAAQARLATADQLAQHGEHPEIRAWCLETMAWNVLTEGDYPRAVDLSRQAQALAPRGSSAHIQATAQEGRAWARMHQPRQTRAALAKVERLVAGLEVPDRPEHHYRYDPDKALAYTATTLSWAGDPAAEEYVRTVIAQLQAGPVGRPRRVASARLDLGLALLAAGKPDEAAAEGIAALASGRIVASNWWRATELLTGVDDAGVTEAADLRDAYHVYQP